MLPPLSWEPLSLRKQPRKWFQNPLKDLESKWFLLFSKSTLIFKRFTKSKSENNFVSKGVENSFSKSKKFSKGFDFKTCTDFDPNSKSFLQLTLPHWSNRFSKPHVLKSFGKTPGVCEMISNYVYPLLQDLFSKKSVWKSF